MAKTSRRVAEADIDRLQRQIGGADTADALTALAALSQDESLRGLMSKDLSAQHDHYLYGTPKRKRR